MPSVSQGFSSLAPLERRAIARRAFVNSLPVLMGYLTMGFAAGVLLSALASMQPSWSASRMAPMEAMRVE